MKTFFTIALCVLLTSVAQGAGAANTISGVWVGNNYETLAILDTAAVIIVTAVFFETSTDRHMFHYTLKGDTLELFSPYLIRGDSLVPFPSDTMSDDYFQPEDTGGFCFIIEHRDSDSLVLRPNSSSTREQFKHAREDDYLFDSTNTITLYSILKDTLLSFDRLMFCSHSRERHEHGLGIRGSAGEVYYPPGKLIERDLKIIMDSSKNVYLYANKYYIQLCGINEHGNKNALKQGYYQGCLPDSMYNHLIDLLRFGALDRMRFKKDINSLCFKEESCDFHRQEYTLDIYYNNKYKRTVGANFPLMSFGLFTYLSSVGTEVPLVKSKTAKKMFEQFYKTRDK